MRKLMTWLAVMAVTAGATLWWMNAGNTERAVRPLERAGEIAVERMQEGL